MREHLQQAAKQGSVYAQDALKGEDCSGVLGYLWDWFMELHGHRGAGPMGAAPLTWPDLDCWARRMRRDPQPWEFDVIAHLDNEFFAATLPATTETK